MTHSKNRLHNVLIIGATPAGVAAANKLGEMGVPITLVDDAADLDHKLNADAYRLESGVPLNYAHRPGLIRILRNSNIRCAMPAAIGSAKHSQQGFRVRIDMPATYVDPDRCTLCGRCLAVCPAGDGTGALPVQITHRMALPGRAVIDKRQAPLCQVHCPLGVNVQGYMALVRAGRYPQALELIRADNVLPGICGRICSHPCEAACRRSEKEGPLAIREVKRFVADQCAAADTTGRPARPERPARNERIAVVGAGPAGLAAATDLARQGYRVTIYEKESSAGGLLRYGIGPHRLPRDILAAEVAAIEAHEGVTIVTGHPVAIPQGLTALRKTHPAVILATGSWSDRRLGVDGEDLRGVEGGLCFLNRFYRGAVPSPKGNVAVIGDGNAAFDLARVLHSLGAKVTILSWFDKKEIPADRDEVHAALEEGIVIQDRCQTVGFRGEEGRLTAVRVQATRPGPLDAQGIAWPVIVADSPVTELAFDLALVAIGQGGAYGALGDGIEGVKGNPQGLIEVDAQGRTGMDGVYAAGDNTTGATSVVHAMAAGRRIAAQVMLDLNGAAEARIQPRAARPLERDFVPLAADLPFLARTAVPEVPAARRGINFNEVVLGFDEARATAEAARCLQCGVCAQCLECLPACGPNMAIRHYEQAQTLMENAGVLIIADPDLAPNIKGDDVIRAYGPPTAKTDVHAMLLRGFSAAARAMVLLQRNGMRMKGQGLAFVPPDPGLKKEVRIGVFACRCNDSMGWTDGMDAFMDSLADQSDVVHAEVLTSACIPEGLQRITDSVRDKGITRLVVASCVCCPLNFVCSACTDQRSRLKRGLFDGTGISRAMVQTCNLRGEVLRLVEKDTPAALTLFKGIMTRSIGRARKLLPFPTPARAYNFATAVIGQTEAARSAALTLAQAGFEVLLFGSAGQPLTTIPEHPLIFDFEGSIVRAISGTLGNFQVHTDCNGNVRIFSVGGVILGEKSRKFAIYRQHERLPEVNVQASMQKAGMAGIPFMYPGTTSISGLFLADPPGIQISKRTKGEAAAVLAAAAMPRGPRQSRGFSVVIDETLCRACGRCLKACPYQAVSLKPGVADGFAAVVDDALCKGCGNCISVCPSNAADSPYRDQAYLEQTLEELLMAGSRS
jgi:NADPH-dependent glutamate synthase beta subunit-like oxidoreductase/NAD-dependent dihydropyrimidine dehydrogenase PreA subunit